MYPSGWPRPGADCSFLRSNHRVRHVRVQPDRGWNGRFVQVLGWNSCASSFLGVQNCVNMSSRLSWRGSSSFCGISRDIDLTRLDLPAATGLVPARTGSCRQFERTRDLCERCLLCFAYAHAADAEKSAFLRCLGNVLADLA